MTNRDTCDASIISELTGNPLGPCMLRNGHDGPVHRAADGCTWWGPSTADLSLRDRLAAALRDAANTCDGHCGQTDAECDTAHPVQATCLTYGTVTHIEGPIDAIIDVVLGALHVPSDERIGL